MKGIYITRREFRGDGLMDEWIDTESIVDDLHFFIDATQDITILNLEVED